MPKNKLRIALIVMVAFYVCVDLVVRMNINDWGRKDWNGILVAFWLTYVLIPLCSVSIGTAVGIFKTPILNALGLLVVNSALCGFVLYDLFFINGISRSISTAWYFKYSFFEGVVFIGSYLIALFLSNKLRK